MSASIELGDRVKDRVTGITGIVICISYWLHGCIRISVQPEKPTKDGRAAEMNHYDELELDLVKKAVHPVLILARTDEKPKRVELPGGPAREGPGFFW